MILHREASQLGRTRTPVLEAWHHFCFAGYQDGNYLNWGRLRVLNHNILAPNTALSPSFHSGTEILFIVQEGTVVIQKDDGKTLAVAANEIASIATGLGTEFGIRSAAGVPARYSVLWLLSDDADYRPHYRGVVGDLSRGDWSAADDFEGGHNLRWSVPARVRLLELESGPFSLSGTDSKTYLAVLCGGISVREMRVDQRDALMMDAEPVLTGFAYDDTRLLICDDGRA